LPGPTHIPSRERVSSEIWKQWIAAGLWLGLITVESTSFLSAENTGRILYSLLVQLFGAIDPNRFAYWHHYLRKSGHVVGYAMLSYLLFRAWRATLPLPAGGRWALKWAQIAFLMTALVATLDEWHQSYIPTRTGTGWDVVLDSSAALTAQVLLWLIFRRTGSTQPDVGRRRDASSRTAETAASIDDK
jgi:VanZ family protein